MVDNAGLEKEVCVDPDDKCVKSAFTCNDCPANTVCDLAKASCDPVSTFDCSQCPANTTCDQINQTCKPNSTGGFDCSQCPANTVCNTVKQSCDPTSGFNCSQCPANTTCNQATQSCDPISSGGGDGGTPGSETCGTYVGPDVSAQCHSCTPGGTSHNGQPCQQNGCYGGWWCDTASNYCHQPPTNCGSSGDGGTGFSCSQCPSNTTCNLAAQTCVPNSAGDGGTGFSCSQCPSNTTCNPVAQTCVPNSTGGGGWTGPVSGSVNSSGGIVSRLYFAIIGDTRPGGINGTAKYPTKIITQIYQDITSLSPLPSFVVTTGDYMYASPTGTQGAAQIQLYQQAENVYPNIVFHALGNHECTGYTASNCGSGNTNGMTNSYQAFLSAWVTPLGYSKPYYTLKFTGQDGKWTAKTVIAAPNAWDSTQASWLQQEMAKPTTFTFFVKHEPPSTSNCPNASAAERIARQYPLTLEIDGHTHKFSFSTGGNAYLIVGNGGAPMTGSGTYGYATVSQISDSQVVVSQFDYSAPNASPSKTWTIDANGTIH